MKKKKKSSYIFQYIVYALVFLGFVGLYVFYRLKVSVNFSEELNAELRKYIGTLAVLVIAYLVQGVITNSLSWYGKNIAAKTETELDDKLIPIMTRTVRVLIWVLAFIVILPFYGINISALVAALGVGSLAIALAAQDTIANVIAGFLIMVDSPFKIGDRIKLPSGDIAIAAEVGLRRSKFIAEDKSRIFIVPNVDLSKSKLENFTLDLE